MTRRKKIIIDASLILVFICLVGLVIYFTESGYQDPRSFALKFKELGLLGPLAIIAIIVMETVAAPLPGFLIAFAAGYAFGGIYGTLITYTGTVLGAMIAFILSRRFGRPLIEHLTSRSKLEFYDCLFQDRGQAILWIVYLIPLLPADIMSFAAGLSAIKLKSFFRIVALAFIPYSIIINFFGAAIYESGFNSRNWLIGGFFLFIFSLAALGFYHYSRRINKTCKK